MSNEIIPFGKYRGTEISEVLQRDPAYMQWLTQQAWFQEKFAPIYQLVINNFAPPSEDTPAHNALQVRFLEFDFQNTFMAQAGIIFNWDWMTKVFFTRTEYLRKAPKPLDKMHRQNTNSTNKYYIDSHRNTVRSHWKTWRYLRKRPQRGIEISKAAFEGVTDVKFTVTAWVGFPRIELFKYEEGEYNGLESYVFYIEIKPSMGDDYPAVLRQIKRQRGAAYRQREEGFSSSHWFLLVDEFASQAVTLDQVRQIFKQDHIDIITMKELITKQLAAKNANS
jgi:hypothetical protein